MLATIIFYMTALLVSVTTAAEWIQQSAIKSYAEKDCKGAVADNNFVLSLKELKGHCFVDTPGQSFSNLQVRERSCKRAYVIAFASADCKDPSGAYNLRMSVWDAADSCINVDSGFGSYMLGCEFEDRS